MSDTSLYFITDQTRIHEVTIQKDTFLVTEYSDRCDKINHRPLDISVKLEKETSPTPSCSRSRVTRTTRSTIRKKRKRKSLVEMLAQHVDQDTLKSVIIAHAKQKCDFSSSPDSESENDSDERGDVVSKIFRTVCTIDLCDDDDETLHEDMLQYLHENQEIATERVHSTVSASTSFTDKLQKSATNQDQLNQPLQLSDEIPKRVEIISDAPEILVQTTDTLASADVGTTLSKTSIHNAPPCEENSSIENIHASTISNQPPSCEEDSLTENVHTSSISNQPCEEDSATENVHASNISEEPVHTAENPHVSIQNVPDTAKADSHKEIISPVRISSVLALESQSNHPTTFDDLENDTEMSVLSPLKTEISKLDNMHVASVTKEPERAVLKLRPFEEISSHATPKNAEKEISINTIVGNKLSFEETLTKADSMVLESKRKSKRIRKTPKPKSVCLTEQKISENSIDANQNNSRLHDKPLESENPSEIKEQPSHEKIKFSSVCVNDASIAGAIKIKIKMEKDSEKSSLDCNSPISILNNEKINGVSKPSRSRKRKSEGLQVASTVTTATTTTLAQNESTRKRPIFDYFESPEILTTKRARKSKSYVDDEDVTPKTQSSNQRTCKRKSNISKSSEENVQPKLESNVQTDIEDAKDHGDTTSTEPVTEPVAEPLAETSETKEEENIKLSLTPPKMGRGIRPPVLAPLNIADLYICGNCKEEVAAKNWTKHTRIHYGLAWRVDVDPPIVSL